ncbi:thymidylate synthase [Alkalihalobacillus trypoxylicola]|uniref:thymidylate synthase n=1 Tax=Alkalihalobacillus trypoxylicola TaxID=519424 RepID=UPI0004AF5F40|nr:thymidylate synthase [Alkalihalobacillus trypoxylicola]
MTVYEKKMIEDIQEQIERLSRELNKLKESPRPVSEFERLETDDFLLQTYN